MRVQELLNVPNGEWDNTKNTENLKLYKRKGLKGSDVCIKTIVKLPGIPKQKAWNCFADINVRKQWDENLHDMTILNEDIEKGTVVFHYTIPTPVLVTTRESVVEKKMMYDFPVSGAWTIHCKSVAHKNKPENPKKFVRVDIKCNCMVFEDCPEVRGTKISWIIHNDAHSNAPRSILESQALKAPEKAINSLTKYCSSHP